MLNRKQINHINMYYKILNLKTTNLHILIENLDKLIDNINNNIYVICYDNVYYYYDRIIKIINNKKIQLDELTNLLNKILKYENEILYLNEEFYKYLTDNNIDYNDKTINKNDYNIIHGINNL